MPVHIHILSPSGAIDPSYIDGAARRLREWGFEVSEALHARGQWGRFAATDDERLADLMQAMENPAVDMILCARGGYGLQRIIDRLPEVNKPIVGFSDITALHQLSGLCGQPSLHAVMCKHIATLPEDSAPLAGLRRALTGGDLHYTWPTHPLNRCGDACGPVVGGNLSVLYGLQATPYSLAHLSYQFPILLIEDVGERHYHIDRMMRNLRMSGVLAHLSGLIVGQFTDCDDDPSMPGGSVEQTIYEAVADYNYPVVFAAPIGHVDANMPLWLHSSSELHVTPDTVSIHIQSPLES
ncbi:MAG: LD-carboxypeptidase [Paludibacteraceae bacterium]|nr:LD-carboxypeptidase [Paludibacteraceae bacterium]